MCRAGKEASERLSPAKETSGAVPVIQSKSSDDNAAHIYEAEGFYGSLISLRSQGAICLNCKGSRNYTLHRLITDQDASFPINVSNLRKRRRSKNAFAVILIAVKR
jgi:hypothetical protein